MTKITQVWQQGDLLEVSITDLTDTGDGVGRVDNRVVFIPDTVPGDRALVRLVRVKSQYATGHLHQLLAASPARIRPHCLVADKCGGCQWQAVDYQYQLETKRNLVIQALERIGGFGAAVVHPVLPSPSPLGYRNKATYPLGLGSRGQVKAGYYQKGSHRLINLNQCPVQDERLNPLLAGLKGDIQGRDWSIYDEGKKTGELRHLSLRIGRRTGEILVTLVVTQGQLIGIADQAQRWLQEYPNIVGVCLNYQPDHNNVIFGEKTDCVAGRPYIREQFSGLEFHLTADTFFQVNTEVAEGLLGWVSQRLNLQGDETLVDAYCGVGTFTLPLAQRVKTAIGLEVQKTAVAQAQLNAQINGLTNVRFIAGTVETLLGQVGVPDVVLLDPPRKGCDQKVLETLLMLKPECIVYMSCKPATLARDLKFLCQSGEYELEQVQPADFFPQTSHVESAALLTRQQSDTCSKS